MVFEPLPTAPWLSVTDEFISVSVKYREDLSQLLKSIPGSKWHSESRQWRYPFTSSPYIRLNFDRINELASQAQLV